jgi:outer membrane protein TolC
MKHRIIIAGIFLLGYLIIFSSNICLAANDDILDSKDINSEPLQLIDLPTTLRLAGANNLDIKIAREKLKQAEAANEAATLKFFPWLEPEVLFRDHQHLIQDTTGNIIEASQRTKAASVILTGSIDVGDDIFNKLVTKQLNSAAYEGMQSQKNDSLLSAADGYFDLVNAEALVGVQEESLRISQSYERQIKEAVEIGITNKENWLQVKVQTHLYQIALAQAEQNLREAAAKLAEILHLDPSVMLTPLDPQPLELKLLPQEMDLQKFIKIALANRPELTQSHHEIKAANHYRQEVTYGPLIPTVNLFVNDGSLGGGPYGHDRSMGNTQNRLVSLNWRIGPGGLFDYSMIHDATAKLHQTLLGNAKLHDDIIRQVVDSHTAVMTTREQTVLARQNLILAQRAYHLARERKQFGVAEVLEAIKMMQDLNNARAEYVVTITSTNEAQYQFIYSIANIGDEPDALH